jgi:hydrogenase maturation protein HypF
MSIAGRRIEIRGIVQGVGFRPWVYRLATEEGVAGSVLNDASGVTIEAFGPEEVLDSFVTRLESSPPPAARIRELRSVAIPTAHAAGFRILQSAHTLDRRVSIPPDLATCPACVKEIFTPGDRRYRYPFTNCTCCGPRFTIARDVPYDRAVTTMAAFRMCPACQREYDAPDDRRFHAQPNACPACGPRLRMATRAGAAVECDDPIRAAAAAIASGLIVAIKGLGGFHLACDASAGEAVERLRARKHRDEKPFAVMVRDVEQARELAVLSDEEERLLASVERPIVLARRREPTRLASSVAPRNPLVGLLLPYTPLHHLLMHDAAAPLVMTSGNLSDEPLAYRDEEALSRLGGIADLFLLHDREIETRCDDSVARVVAGRPVVFRRSRGWVPRPVSVTRRFEVPVLACGALLKNTFCIGAGDSAFLGPHIGDLENLETYRSFEESVARMERFLGVVPEIIAHDLHPDYMSTAYARARPETVKIGVQHHHAHVASAMAEHGLAGPVLGVAYDGTGLGLDGTSWGGELLLARYDRFERLATLRPVSLAGGDAAIRHPWRVALALVDDAFDHAAPVDRLRLFSALRAEDLAAVRRMIATGLRSPLAHGLGRYFDGVGALGLARTESRYEGQIALEWNVIADERERGRYAWDVDLTRSPWMLDLRPMVRGIVRDLLAGRSGPVVSARFHNTIAAATADLVRRAGRVHGALPVVLTGGCFQNSRLAESVAGTLASGFAVHLHGDVPPGDGGLALGQAVIAAALARRFA